MPAGRTDAPRVESCRRLPATREAGGLFTLEDVRKNRSNILFFGNFVNLPLDTFRIGIREIIEDEQIDGEQLVR